MDEIKHPTPSETSKENDKVQAASGKAAPAMGSRKVFSKRWLYPAIYLGAAALIIGLMYVRSQSGNTPTASNDVETNQGNSGVSAQQMAWPVAATTQPKVTVGFFPVHGTKAQQDAAVVVYDNGFYPHQGIDIQSSTGNAFDVQAAIDGKVTAVVDQKSNGYQLYGQEVEVTGSNGIVTRYESLSKVSVKVGDSIKQGQVIGTSGTCLFEKAQKNHLYFEVVQNGKTVDPMTLLPKLS